MHARRSTLSFRRSFVNDDRRFAPHSGDSREREPPRSRTILFFLSDARVYQMIRRLAFARHFEYKRISARSLHPRSYAAAA